VARVVGCTAQADKPNTGRPSAHFVPAGGTNRPPGRTARFRFVDGVLRVRGTLRRDYRNGWIGDRTYTLEARLDDDGASGTLRYVEVIRYGDRARYDCDSGAVTFSARTT
jgi:hypothetical protein